METNSYIHLQTASATYRGGLNKRSCEKSSSQVVQKKASTTVYIFDVASTIFISFFEYVPLHSYPYSLFKCCFSVFHDGQTIKLLYILQMLLDFRTLCEKQHSHFSEIQNLWLYLISRQRLQQPR